MAARAPTLRSRATPFYVAAVLYALPNPLGLAAVLLSDSGYFASWTYSLLHTATFLVTATLFLRWWSVATARAREIGRSGAPLADAGQLVIAFFVPIWNFYKPYVHVQNLARALDPRDLAPPLVRREREAPAYREVASELVPAPFSMPWIPVGVWWAAWYAPLVGRMVASPLLRQERLGGWIGWVATAAQPLCLLWIVRGINRAADERARRLEAAREAEQEAARKAAS